MIIYSAKGEIEISAFSGFFADRFRVLYYAFVVYIVYVVIVIFTYESDINTAYLQHIVLVSALVVYVGARVIRSKYATNKKITIVQSGKTFVVNQRITLQDSCLVVFSMRRTRLGGVYFSLMIGDDVEKMTLLKGVREHEKETIKKALKNSFDFPIVESDDSLSLDF